MSKKILLSGAVSFVIIAPLACLTDLFRGIPWPVFSLLTRSYWSALDANPKFWDLYTLVAFLAGAVVGVFLLFWFLWIQRNKQETMLSIYARSTDVYAWLRKWTELPGEELPAELKKLTSTAQRLFRKLDRLLCMDDRDNWRWWYTFYLTIFWFLNGPKLLAFRGVRVEPPPEAWPTPGELIDRLDSEDIALATNALEFSEGFVAGAKAWTGHCFMMETVVGTIFTGILAVLVGCGCAIALAWYGAAWMRPLFPALTFSVAVGLVAGYLWQRISSVVGKGTPTKSSPDPEDAGEVATS